MKKNINNNFKLNRKCFSVCSVCIPRVSLYGQKSINKHMVNGLPEYLHNRLIGNLLGDLSITRVSSKSSRMTFSMGDKNFEYASYLANLFKSYSNKGLYNLKVQAKKEEDFPPIFY